MISRRPIKKHKKNFIKNKRFKKSFLEGIKVVDYKDVELLKKFLNKQGKILPRKITGVSLKEQKIVAIAIKRARIMALLPFVQERERR